MKITVNAKVIKLLQLKKGVSSRGNAYQTQDVVVETDDGDVLCVNIFGEQNLENYHLAIGDKASFTIDVSSKEFGGKYYTSLKCVECINSAPKETTPQQPVQQAPVAPPRVERREEQISADALPF